MLDNDWLFNEESFTWETEGFHTNNETTMTVFIEEIMPSDWKIIESDIVFGVECIVECEGRRYVLESFGNGDSTHHITRVKESLS